MASWLKIAGNERGLSLAEVLVVIAILSILLTIGGLAFRTMTVNYQVENEAREMFSDMMNARARANARNRAYFVTINAATYQVTEDTNESGALDAGDAPLWPTPKQLNYQVLTPTPPVTVVMDTKGVVSQGSGPFLPDATLSIQFDSRGTTPAYDCILLAPTRINMGSWDGTTCVAK